ncbi:MAG: small multi-drug export protein [Lachnospiraceae bacterium]|nr:small multi-drug export protein [Lachnospiraceae bacterium]
MDQIVQWLTEHLGKIFSGEIITFIISMIPLLELRGGLLAAKLMDVPLIKAIPLCIAGNIIPIPFILLFIKSIFRFMRAHGILVKLIDKIENRAMKKSAKVEGSEFIGLMLFVGIPLPGTGAWMGSLIAALLNIDIKKAIVAELIGIIMATIICSILWYGLLGLVV